MRAVVVSHHAVDRWLSRVCSGGSAVTARGEVERFIATGRVRPTPRRWMRDVAAPPGVTFMYSADSSGVCAVIRDGVIVTFLTRSLFDRSADRHSDARQRKDVRTRARDDRASRVAYRRARAAQRNRGHSHWQVAA